MKALLTCGIGDFLAIEPTLRYNERPSHIYWATRAEAALRQLVPLCFPVSEQITVFSDFSEPFTPRSYVASAADLHLKTGIQLPDDVVDLSVLRIGHEVLRGERAIGSSWFAGRRIADVSRFNLPLAYCVIHPYSQNARSGYRDFEAGEWAVVELLLEGLGLPGVVVNHGPELGPERFVDLTNRTSLLEALQVTADASAFIGCASALSVMAGRVLPRDRFFVKGHSQLRHEWVPFYYPNHNDCVREHLRDFCV